MYSYNKTTNNKFCSWVLFDSFVVHKFITYNRLTISKFSFVTAEPILRPFVDNEEETKALNSMSFIGCSSASDVLIIKCTDLSEIGQVKCLIAWKKFVLYASGW